jgi:hypothetical protein
MIRVYRARWTPAYRPGNMNNWDLTDSVGSQKK